MVASRPTVRPAQPLPPPLLFTQTPSTARPELHCTRTRTPLLFTPPAPSSQMSPEPSLSHLYLRSHRGLKADFHLRLYRTRRLLRGRRQVDGWLHSVGYRADDGIDVGFGEVVARVRAVLEVAEKDALLRSRRTPSTADIRSSTPTTVVLGALGVLRVVGNWFVTAGGSGHEATIEVVPPAGGSRPDVLPTTLPGKELPALTVDVVHEPCFAGRRVMTSFVQREWMCPRGPG